MRRGNGGFREIELRFKLSYDFRAEEVLHHVRIAIDMTGRDVGVLDQIEFPKPMVSGQSGSFSKPSLGETELAGWLSLQMILRPGLPDETGEFAF